MTTTFPRGSLIYLRKDSCESSSRGVDMNGLMNRSLTAAHHHCHCQGKAKRTGERPRHLHQSTLSFGDAAPSYTTTFNQSFSGREADGRPLVFRLRDPSLPSQHQSWLDLGNAPRRCPLRSHSQEVHGPKHVAAVRLQDPDAAPRTKPKVRNRAQPHSGQTIREVMNPQGPSEYWTTYESEHTLPATDASSQPPGGKPTRWHRHNILTGEQTQVAGPGTPCRRSRDRQLWEARQAAARHLHLD